MENAVMTVVSALKKLTKEEMCATSETTKGNPWYTLFPAAYGANPRGAYGLATDFDKLDVDNRE